MQRVQVEKTRIDITERKLLSWYGHIRTVPEDSWSKRICEWQPPFRIKRGRPRLTWPDGIKTAMETRQSTEEDVEDREGWNRGADMRRQM